jgi:hypothetical protein
LTPFLGFISNSKPQNEALVEEDAEVIELSEDLEEVEEEEEYDEEVIKEATTGDSSGKDSTSGNLEEEAEEEEEEADAEEEVTEAKEEAEREYDVSLKTVVCMSLLQTTDSIVTELRRSVIYWGCWFCVC